MCPALLLYIVGTPQKLIWMDTQGCVTHIVKIFKFGDVSGPMGMMPTHTQPGVSTSQPQDTLNTGMY